MKKNIIALAVAAAVAAPMAAQAAPTVYGQMNMVVGQDRAGKDTGMTVDSVASRVGVKGSSDLGKGLKAIYKIEFGAGIDEDGGRLKGRNQFVGLAGGFGTVLMGRHDTPLKMSQPKDFFNDGALDNGKVTRIGSGNSTGGEDRVQETLAYVSPSFANTKLILALVPNEGLTGTTTSSIVNIYSLAVMHGSKKKGLYVAGAINSADKDSGDTTYMRISGQYAAAGMVANLMYQTSDYLGAEGNNITVGLGYKMGKMMPKFKYSMTSEDESSGKKGTVIGLGLDYKMAKKTTAYAEIGLVDEDFAGTGNDYTSVTVGLLHKF